MKISPKQSKELAEKKKTKGKTNGWAERGDEVKNGEKFSFLAQ